MDKNSEEKLNEFGLKIPHILFPNKNIKLTKFSCIAVDQYRKGKKNNKFRIQKSLKNSENLCTLSQAPAARSPD